MTVQRKQQFLLTRNGLDGIFSQLACNIHTHFFTIFAVWLRPNFSFYIESFRQKKGQRKESESELFTGDTFKDNHSPEPVIRGVSP